MSLFKKSDDSFLRDSARKSVENLKELYSNKSSDEFKCKGDITPVFFKELITVLNNYAESLELKNDLEQLFTISWDKNFHFIPEYDKDNENKTKKILNTNDEEIFKTVHPAELCY